MRLTINNKLVTVSGLTKKQCEDNPEMYDEIISYIGSRLRKKDTKGVTKCGKKWEVFYRSSMYDLN